MPLFLIFVAVPMTEIALFILVGGWIGLWPTLGLVVLSALVGTVLMRAQGMAALERLQRALAQGRDPTGPLADGAALLIAGLLLLTPGFFTDTVGIALMLPGPRRRIIRWIGRQLVARGAVVFGTGHESGPIDADYEIVAPETPDTATRKPDGPPSGWVRKD
jgi:UPF0716 protein FxsA